MKTLYRILLVAAAGVTLFSCKDELSVSSPSVVDKDFVFGSYETAKTVMLGAYNNYISANTNSEGFFCNWDNISSDVERCSVGNITDLVGGSQLYLAPYSVDRFNINFIKGIWSKMYNIIARCNQVIYNVESFSNFDEIKATAPNDWSDLLGQAYALRATMYYDLARYFGDALYIDEAGKDITDLSGRDFIIENEIEHLKAIEPLMYKVGQNGHLPDQMTRNYVDGLIARLCFMEAGYQTRRTDLGADFYTDKDGKAIQFDVWGTDAERNAQYARRSDWKNFYQTAIPYLKKAVEDPGEVALTTVDPREGTNGRVFGNPFQYYFEQVTQQNMAYETVYEISMKEIGGSSRIAYNYGRGSNGGSPAYPPKANAQTSSYPRVFYANYDPQDMRRDASLTVTGSSGNGVEIIDNFGLSNKVSGGICMNKYDLNRQINPDARQLYSGINFIQMRQADIILMLAEAYAQTGDNGNAETYLKMVHNRAFAKDIQDAKYSELIASCGGSVIEAIYKERSLEFVGEGLRRWDLIRTGKLPEVAVNFRKALVDDMAELKANGFVQYANGNQYPAYIWTKTVNAKEILGYRLTAQTPAGVVETADPDDIESALLIPGYRGQHDDWTAVAREDNSATVINEDKTNLAIKGLFKFIPEDSTEGQALKAAGWEKTKWGSDTYQLNNADNADREAEWSSKFMGGYTDADYAAKKAPIYLIPYEQTVCVTTGLTNGYGLPTPGQVK